MIDDDDTICQACGACCSYSAQWPRFGLEDAVAIARIPAQYVSPCQSGMRCEGDRCSALSGTVGVATACRAYASRPDVCRECLPGDVECNLARAKFGVAPLPARISG